MDREAFQAAVHVIAQAETTVRLCSIQFIRLFYLVFYLLLSRQHCGPPNLSSDQSSMKLAKAI